MRAEALLGEAISDQIARHHRRRLRRIGWEHALDADGVGWAGGAPPPRPGNAIEILIDGAEALPAIARELESARSHIHMTAWYLSPGVALVRDSRPTVLRHLLAELAEHVDVRVLVWAGAPLPLFHPSRRQVREMRERLQARLGVRPRLELVAQGTIPRTEFKAKRVIDDRDLYRQGVSREPT